MLKLSDYNQSFTLAVSKCNNWVMSAAKYGNVWRFVIEHKTDPNECGAVGEPYTSKQELLNSAFVYITDLSGYGNIFTFDTLQPVVKELKPVYLSNDQITAINMAIRLLNNSQSDHADQTVCYLKQITKLFK